MISIVFSAGILRTKNCSLKLGKNGFLGKVRFRNIAPHLFFLCVPLLSTAWMEVGEHTENLSASLRPGLNVSPISSVHISLSSDQPCSLHSRDVWKCPEHVAINVMFPNLTPWSCDLRKPVICLLSYSKWWFSKNLQQASALCLFTSSFLTSKQLPHMPQVFVSVALQYLGTVSGLVEATLQHQLHPLPKSHGLTQWKDICGLLLRMMQAGDEKNLLDDMLPCRTFASVPAWHHYLMHTDEEGAYIENQK